MGIVFVIGIGVIAYLLGVNTTMKRELENSQNTVKEEVSSKVQSNQESQTQIPEDKQKPLDTMKFKSQDGQSDISCDISSSWENGKRYNAQINVVVSNQGSNNVDGWQLEWDVGKDAKLVQIWNAKAKMKGNMLVITAESYNESIKAGESADFGFIIDTTEKYSFGKVSTNW